MGYPVSYRRPTLNSPRRGFQRAPADLPWTVPPRPANDPWPKPANDPYPHMPQLPPETPVKFPSRVAVKQTRQTRRFRLPIPRRLPEVPMWVYPTISVVGAIVGMMRAPARIDVQPGQTLVCGPVPGGYGTGYIGWLNYPFVVSLCGLGGQAIGDYSDVGVDKGLGDWFLLEWNSQLTRESIMAAVQGPGRVAAPEYVPPGLRPIPEPYLSMPPWPLPLPRVSEEPRLGPNGRPSNQPNFQHRPPPPGTKEAKFGGRGTGVLGSLLATAAKVKDDVNFYNDVVTSFYLATGGKGKNVRPDKMIKYIYRHYDQLDIAELSKNLAYAVAGEKAGALLERARDYVSRNTLLHKVSINPRISAGGFGS